MGKDMMDLDRIYNMDCIEGMRLIAEKSVDLVVTDPPYLHCKGHTYKDYDASTSKFSKSSLYRFDGMMLNDMNGFGADEIDNFLSSVVHVMKRMNCYVFASESQIVYYLNWANNHGYYSSVLVWEKPLSVINKNRFSQNVEFIIRIYEHGTGLRKLSNSSAYSRVKRDSPVLGADKLHPTQKPLSLVMTLVELNSDDGDVVLDPFMGSGTTALACIKEKRHYIGFEINKEFCDIANKRIKSASQQLTLDFKDYD